MVCLPIAILSYGAYFIISLILSISFDFTGNTVANFFITSAGILVLIFGIGCLLSLNWLANLIQKLLRPLRKSSIVQIISAFLNRKSFDRAKERGVPEVIFESAPGTWKFGVITNELKAKDKEGNEVAMHIIFELTSPVPFSGAIFLKKESEVVYTGRTFKATAINSSSCWLNFPGFDEKIQLP